MDKLLLLLLGLAVSFTSVAATTPLQLLLDSELSNVKTYSQTIKKWDCGKYQNTASMATCEYYKAYLSHEERQYDEAQRHVKALANTLYQDSNFALMGIDASFVKQQVRVMTSMYDSALQENEDGGIGDMSTGSLTNTLLNGGNGHPFGSAVFTANFIDYLYDKRQAKSIKHNYLRLGQDLREWQVLEGAQSKTNVASAYHMVLSKLILGDQIKDEHAQYVNTLWHKIPKSQRSKNRDTLIAMYIQSGKRALQEQDLKLAVSELNSAEQSSDDLKIRLYLIYLWSMINSIPESERMPKGDYSKFMIRYFNLLSPEQQKQYKNMLTESVNIVLTKSSPKTAIDELVVADHVIIRDLLNVTKPKGSYYKSLDNKYSVLRKDYVDFTDQSSKEVSTLNYLGGLSRTSLGEGLM